AMAELLAAEGGGEALRAVERRRRRRHARARERGGRHRVQRGVARVIRLRHRAEVLLEARREGGRDAERVRGLREVEALQPRGGGGAADGPQRGGGVPPARVVSRV